MYADCRQGTRLLHSAERVRNGSWEKVAEISFRLVRNVRGVRPLD